MSQKRSKLNRREKKILSAISEIINPAPLSDADRFEIARLHAEGIEKYPAIETGIEGVRLRIIPAHCRKDDGGSC